MARYGWVAVLISVATVANLALAAPAPADQKATPTEDQGSLFVDELVANLTEVQAKNRKKTLSCGQSSSLTVDLGYAKYQGYHDSGSKIDIWKGVRYAQPPTGNLRWQAPRLPNHRPNAPVEPATDYGPICPQNYPAVPGIPFIPGDEDCLFLNVYAPPNAQDLPVMVWIHEGGYGYGDGRRNMAEIINDNGQTFVAVSIQYRLNAFGFLSSAEVKKRGVVNAGLLDQAFALAWVKEFACQFGGDPSRVTIAGESAGASSVVYHGMAVDGSLGSLLFDNGIVASPYLPFQYEYDDDWVTDRYYALAEEVGCGSSGKVFTCLKQTDSMDLQLASHTITQRQTYGSWAYYPVTDYCYIMNLPSQQLSQKKVNGERMLVGNVANEGPLFVPPVITTESDLADWLHLEFENLSSQQIQAILDANPNSQNTDPANPRFETDGLNPLTAIDVSQDSNGQQQRGANIYAESTFVCPSYWMADAWTSGLKSAWHYQYSVPFSSHTTDLPAYFGPQSDNQGGDLVLAIRKMWGNFITGNNPSISNSIANGASSSDPSVPNGASSWPKWNSGSPQHLNINQTGGVPYEFTTQWGTAVTQFMEPGLVNAIAVVPADTWEGGRRDRCDFWLEMASSIPI